MGFFDFAPAGAEEISFTSSPLSFLGPVNVDNPDTVISSTVEEPSADVSKSSGHSTAGDIIASIGNTIIGAIAISRLPSQQLSKTGIGQSAQQTQLQQRQLQLQSQQQTFLFIGIIAAVVVLIIFFRK